MSQPLMPLGVEHNKYMVAAAHFSVVSQPLMPLGVEHVRALVEAARAGTVSQPLMPLGVEHALRNQERFTGRK